MYDKRFFPYRKEELIKQLDEGDDELDIRYKASSPIRWLEYDPSVSIPDFPAVLPDFSAKFTIFFSKHSKVPKNFLRHSRSEGSNLGRINILS